MKWFIVFLLTTIIWLVASSLYIYDVKHPHRPHPDEGHLPPHFMNLSADVRHSFLGLQPDQVVCYRESHRNFYVFTFILLSSVVGLVAFGLLAQRRNNRILADKNDEVMKQRELLTSANENIYSSLRYASVIQSSYLPSSTLLSQVFNSHCLIYKPKDLVSGDFYFCRQYGNKLVVALGDCTGHGVPGAFLTVTSLNHLENLAPSFLTEPHELLNAIQKEFDGKSDQPEVHMGLDLAVCVFDLETKELCFASALQSLIIQRPEGFEEWKGTRKGIGSTQLDSPFSFSTQTTLLKGNEHFYLFSDGITDQFGGGSAKKIGKKRLLEWIKQTDNNLSQKQTALTRLFTEWQGQQLQTDDVCLLGFSLNDACNSSK
jgi:serine phosphatase RsbU (regulator of sigma subunit)